MINKVYHQTMHKQDTLSKPKALFCWSGGKDSALALHKVLQEGKYEVMSLLTTINRQMKRVSMHGVPEALIEAQAVSIGLPLCKVYVDADSSNDNYEKSMEACLLAFKAEGVETVIFGDIFLEDLKTYRENNLAKVGMKGAFPLWKKDTMTLVQEFLELGFATIVCCTNEKIFGSNCIGEALDLALIENFPSGVDPCGENGEFHTFVHAGPLFKEPIQVAVHGKVLKNYQANGETFGFWFADLQLEEKV